MPPRSSPNPAINELTNLKGETAKVRHQPTGAAAIESPLPPADAPQPQRRAQRPSVARKPVTREYRTRASTIAKILDAVTLLVHRNGAESLTVQAVCERASISRGAFYRYFDSKESVLLAWVDDMQASYAGSIRDIIVENSDAKSRLAAYVSTVTEMISQHNFRSLVQAEPDLAIRLLEQRYSQQTQRTADVFDVVFASWEEVLGRPVDRQMLAELIHRCQLSTTIIPTKLKPEDVARHLEDLLSTLKKRGA